MQNVSFSSLEEFFDFITPHEYKIIQILRNHIIECIPRCKEKLSWNVPYYYGNSGICFLWPSSVSWGKVHNVGTIRLGFMKAYLMNDELNYLDKGDRKQVYWKDFSNIDEIDLSLLKRYILEAVYVDELYGKGHKNKH